MSLRITEFWERALRWYCLHFHGRVYWPICGKFRCCRCLREWEAPFR